MEKPVKISGLSTRSEHDPGASYNLVNLAEKNGAIVPVTPRFVDSYLSESYSQIFIHTTGSYSHWIGISNSKLYYFRNYNQSIEPIELMSVSGDVSMTSIGNVVNIVSNTGIKYLIWYQGTYKAIASGFDGAQDSQQIGFLKNIGLRINRVNSKPIVYRTDVKTSNDPYIEDDAIESIRGLFLKAIGVESRKGYTTGFMLGCIAFELFDGSVVMHQSPVLLCQSDDVNNRYSIPFGNYMDSPVVSYVSDEIGMGIHRKFVYMGGNLEYDTDVDGSYELVDGVYIPASGLSVIPHRAGVKQNNQSTLLIYPKPDSTSTAYWTVLADDSDPSWATLTAGIPNYTEQYEDASPGTKYIFEKFADATTPIDYLVERTSTPFEFVPHSFVGYRDMFFTEIYNNVILRRSSLQINIQDSISEELRPLIKGVNVYITPQVSMYDLEKEFTVVSALGPTSVVHSKNYIPHRKSDSDIIEELMSESFRLVKEIPFDEINAGSWTDIDLAGKLGDNLNALPVMPVDPFSHHTMKPEKQYVYNSRLHILNYTTELSRGWPIDYLKSEAGAGQFKVDPVSIEEDIDSFAAVSIKTETGISTVVRSLSGTQVIPLAPIISYPDSRAVAINLVRQAKVKIDADIRLNVDGTIKIGATWVHLVKVGTVITNQAGTSSMTVTAYNANTGDATVTPAVVTPVQMTQTLRMTVLAKSKLVQPLIGSKVHNFAYAINSSLKPYEIEYTKYDDISVAPAEESVSQVYENGLKVSSVFNPFNFPLVNTYSIGTGAILNMATNALRMSEGQFGQYPLYVFTETGIYSLQVGAGSVYLTSQAPASIEIPISDKVLETPFGVVFITREGLKVINGQQVDAISPQLEEDRIELSLEKSIPGSFIPGDISDPLFTSFTDNSLKSVLADTALIMVYNHEEEEVILRVPGMEYTFVLRNGSWYLSTEKFNYRIEGVGSKLLVVSGDSYSIPDHDCIAVDGDEEYSEGSIVYYKLNSTTGKTYDEAVEDAPSGYSLPTRDNVFALNRGGKITDNSAIWIYDESVPPGDLNAFIYDQSHNEIVAATKNYISDYTLYVKTTITEKQKVVDYSKEGSVTQDCAFILRPVDFGNNLIKRLSRVKVIAEMVNVSKLYFMNHVLFDDRNGKAITGVYISEDRDSYNGPYNLKDIDSMRISVKGRYFVTSLGFRSDKSTRIHRVDYQVDTEYDNGKL